MKKFLFIALGLASLVSSAFAATSIEGEWSLQTFNGSNTSGRLTLESGFFSSQFCNLMNGKIVNSGSTIQSVGPVMSTMMYCDGLPMTLDAKFNLVSPAQVSLSGNSLTVTTASGNVYVFTEKVPEPVVISTGTSTGTLVLIVGNDKDSHGCIGSAGYVWNTGLQQCVRPWEIGTGVTSGTISGLLVGDDKDTHGCIASAGYVWSKNLDKCVRPWEPYEITTSYKISGIATIDNLIYGVIEKRKKEFIAEALKLHNEMLADAESGELPSRQPTLNLECKTVTNSNYVSVVCDGYEFMGGAHGMPYTWTFNLTKNGKFVFLPSLFKNNKSYLRTLSTRLYTHFKNKVSSDKKWLQDGLAPKLANYDDFVLNVKNGKIVSITFYFEPYQIASYADGQQSVTVSYPGLKVIK